MDTTAARSRGRSERAPSAATEINLRPAEAPPGQIPQTGGGGPGSGVRTGPAVAPGEYLVTITVGGATMKRVLRVERIGDIPPDPGS